MLWRPVIAQTLASASAIRVRQLEAFQAVAQTGSITRAAQHLGISQPAVSRLMRDLAAAMGVPLLSRDGRRMVPTQDGRFLLGEVSRVLETLRNFDQLTLDFGAQRAGHLRIACLPGFATTHLPTVLGRFLRDRDRVDLVVEPDRPERILDWIVSGNCDVGFTADFPGHPAVERQRIPIRTVCVLPSTHPLADETEVTPDALRGERLIHPKRDDPFCRAIFAAFDDFGVPVTSHIETRQFGAACRLVAEGLGVTIVSCLDAHEYAHLGLVARPFFPPIPHNLDILRSRLTSGSMLAAEFVEAFQASLNAFRFDERRLPGS